MNINIMGGKMKGLKLLNAKLKSQNGKWERKEKKRKYIIERFFLLIILLIFHSQLVSSDREDLRVIKKVVKAEEFSISSKSFNEAKWLKISITEKKRMKKDGVEIRIYLPFVETILKTSKNCRIRNEKTDIDLKEIIEDLKNISSMELFLLEDEESIVKIWLE